MTKMRASLLASAASIVFSVTPGLAQELEEVVVTAQKKSEKIQDVPITIAAVTGDALSAAGVGRLDELSTVVPGFSLTREGASTELYIRGVGSTGGSAGQESEIATFVDGVYMPSQSGATLALNNVERIEVLKGPQGTLYGRNATGGAMNIITPTPSFDPSFRGEIGFGNLGTIEGNIYATSGFGDKVAADIAASVNDQEDGFGKNVATGKDTNTERDFSFRSKILIKPTDDTTITLSGDYGVVEGSVGVAYRNYGPGSRQILTGIDGWPYGYWDIDSDINPFFRDTTAGGSGRIEQNFDWAKLTSITAYRTVGAPQTFNINETAAPLFNAFVDEQVRQFTQEFQLASNSDAPIQWIAGLYYLNGISEYRPWSIYGALFAASGFSEEVVEDSQKTLSYAAFGQAFIDITPSTKLTLGLRYTLDEQTLDGTGYLLLLDGTKVPAFPDQNRSKNFEKPTWRISLNHKFDENILGYVSYNRGFQSGIFNLNGSAITAPAVNPERLDAYEAGVKSTLFDHRLRLNASAFYYEYNNLQLAKIVDGTQFTVNAASAEMYGLDVDFDAALTENLFLSGGGELLHARYTDFTDAPATTTLTTFPYGNTVLSRDATGNLLNRTPNYSFTISADYIAPVYEGSFDASATYVYTGAFYWEPDNRLRQDAYRLVNTQIKWTAPGGKYYVRAFAKNLLNQEYITFAASSALGDIGSAAPGRTYGVAVGWKF